MNSNNHGLNSSNTYNVISNHHSNNASNRNIDVNNPKSNSTWNNRPDMRYRTLGKELWQQLTGAAVAMLDLHPKP